MNRIFGRRIHFAGSANKDVSDEMLFKTHQIFKRLSRRMLMEGGGLVVTLGAEPAFEKDEALSAVFDWTILEACNDVLKNQNLEWPMDQGLPIVAIGLPNWKERIPQHRNGLIMELIQSKTMEIITLESGISAGGPLRERQAEYGDILVIAGGTVGVNHLVKLYRTDLKPVIPLDMKLRGNKESASEKHSARAAEEPSRYFEYQFGERAIGEYVLLNNGVSDSDEFEEMFVDFINNLDLHADLGNDLIVQKIRRIGARSESIALEELRKIHSEIMKMKNPNKRGYAFQEFVYKILEREGIKVEGSFRPSGEEIDGYIVDYRFLLECKWEKSEITFSKVRSFRDALQIRGLQEGIFWSMSGFREAVHQRLGEGTDKRVYLFDNLDLDAILQGSITFSDLTSQKQRLWDKKGPGAYNWPEIRAEYRRMQKKQSGKE